MVDLTEEIGSAYDPVETCLVENGGSYLLVVDCSPEFRTALKAASFLALRHRAHIALLSVMEPPDFQQWGSVEDRILAEQRRKSEKAVQDAARILNDLNGQIPSFFVCEGVSQDIIVDLIGRNPDIKALVLGAGSSSNPLISYFVGKGLPHLSIPLFVIPDIK